MATQFLSDTQETSDIINPRGYAPSGSIIIAFFGAMNASDEKWQIEMAEYDKAPADRVWAPTHATDFLNARHPPGTSIDLTTTPPQIPINLWEGPRHGNRVFEIPVADGFVYRVTLVYKIVSNVLNLTNTSVTACWEEAKTKTWL